VNATTGTAGSRGPDFSSAKDSANDAFNRGKEGLTKAAYDLDGLRKDLDSLKDTVSKFVSQAGDVSSSVATKVGNAASSLAESGSDIASAATDRAKSFASELEGMGRRNPLGAMAAALLVGVMIGVISRGRSS
jgi:ElaB/YqjD/DUF883 family membrane-anchored ribosome-binding protein